MSEMKTSFQNIVAKCQQVLNQKFMGKLSRKGHELVDDEQLAIVSEKVTPWKSNVVLHVATRPPLDSGLILIYSPGCAPHVIPPFAG